MLFNFIVVIRASQTKAQMQKTQELKVMYEKKVCFGIFFVYLINNKCGNGYDDM